MPKLTVKLTHSSSHPDATGNVGDIVECDEALAQRFIDGGGAERVETTAPAETQTVNKTGN